MNFTNQKQPLLPTNNKPQVSIMDTFLQQQHNIHLVHESYEGSLFMTTNDVIKVLNTNRLDDSDLENALKMTIEFSEKIPEYVPKFYSVYKLPGEIAITMEKIYGQTLNQYINSLTTRDYSPEEILTVVSSLCSATDALFKLGYVHGDLNKNNILVEPSLKVKLIDFTQSDLITAVDPGDCKTLKLYDEQLYISVMIADLIFLKKHPNILNTNICQAIKQIKDYTVDDVIGDDEIATKLFNIFNLYRPSWFVIENY